MFFNEEEDHIENQIEIQQAELEEAQTKLETLEGVDTPEAGMQREESR